MGNAARRVVLVAALVAVLVLAAARGLTGDNQEAASEKPKEVSVRISDAAESAGVAAAVVASKPQAPMPSSGSKGKPSAVGTPSHEAAKASPPTEGASAEEPATTASPNAPAAAGSTPQSPPAALAAATPVPTRAKATDVPAGQTCRWRFVKYHPSEFEKRWRDDINTLQFNVCASLTGDSPLRVYHDEYIRMLGRCASNAPSRPSTYPTDCATRTHAPREDFPDRTFSKFEYAFVCAPTSEALVSVPVTASMPRHYSYIEPLAGLLRHPKTCGKPRPTMFDKGYLLVDPWAAHRNDAYVPEGLSSSRRPGQVRSWYFDLGASTWSQGLGGASQEWFYSTYRDVCVDFDRFLMWEVTPERPKRVLSKIPGPLRPRYHWFNVPAEIKPGYWGNPLTHIEAETTEDDFVMLKIDIDTPRIELPLVEQIANSPRLAALIDEFYFEHHVNVEVMGPEWSLKPTHPTYQNASIEIFSRLRELGIRAHSWI